PAPQDMPHPPRPTARLGDLPGRATPRRGGSDYIRQHWGQAARHALGQTRREPILLRRRQGQLSTPRPQQRPPTLRPLLPAEHNTLNQLVTKLAAATGEPSKLIWQSMLELCGVKSGELIPATHFLPLSYWLQARQTLSAQSAPTLTSLQGALKQPLEAAEWQTIVDFARRSWQVTPRTTLSPAQILALLNKVFVLRVARAQETLAIPQEEPVARRTWSAKPWQLALGAVVLLLVLWLLL
ncbi:flagella biosynthesis regulator Flk, partial [Klebsiella pneumoniae]|uniref:flagella biosynthesis regulator Flk n=1 Tax=Klebsiella pneumoniae TaxID=573 RepID=UPI00195639B0